MSVSESGCATGGEILVLRISGEVDVATVPQVCAALVSLLARRPTHAILDLSGLKFCSVRGLAVLQEAAATAAERSIGFSVAAPPRAVLRSWVLMAAGGELPARHRTAGAAVLAAVADRNRSRGRSVPGGSPAGVSGPPRLRLVRDPDRFDGDADAYRALARRHRTRICRSVLLTLASSGDPDDLADHLRAAVAVFAEVDGGRGAPGGPS